MNAADQLLVIAQISIALAGFAGIIATFQFKDDKNVSRGHVLALGMVVNISLVGAFFSALPLALLNFEIRDELVWTICSTLMAINLTVFTLYIYKRARLDTVDMRSRIVFVSFFVLSAVVVTFNTLNALGIGFDREFAPYLLSFFFSFFLVCYNFSRLLMRPLWRQIHKREREEAEMRVQSDLPKRPTRSESGSGQN